MCKPATTELPIHRDGPCGFTVRSYSDACAAFSLGWSWRARVANVLRHWADKAEGVRSLVIVAEGPPQITFGDALDAATVGFNGANQYLNDLWRERVHGATEAAPIVPVKTVR